MTNDPQQVGLALFIGGMITLFLALLTRSPRSKAQTAIEPVLTPRKQDTAVRCSLCGHKVSYRKITGDVCTLCHVKTVPVTEIFKETEKEVKPAIPAEVIEDA